jgi:hypothetical protein
MRRRRILAGLLLAFVAPLAAEAQPAAKVPVIGMLDYGAPDAARLAWWKALREGLQELGYVEGRSISFEARWAEGRVDRLSGLAAELVRLQVNVIVTGGGEAARAGQAGNGDQSHCHGERSGSSTARARCEPCTARRQRHRSDLTL